MTDIKSSHLPPPNPLPGAPFEDGNLKLVVIDALLTSGHIDLGGPVNFLSAMLGRRYDPSDDPQWLYKCEAAHDYLLRYPLTHEHLTAVESLCFDGGSEIYRHIWPGWDGEGGDFDVRALDGLELLPNLRDFYDIAMLHVDDFRALTAMPNLQWLRLAPDTRVPADIVLSLPSLKLYTCYSSTPHDPALLAALKARGVRIGV